MKSDDTPATARFAVTWGGPLAGLESALVAINSPLLGQARSLPHDLRLGLLLNLLPDNERDCANHQKQGEPKHAVAKGRQHHLEPGKSRHQREKSASAEQTSAAIVN